MLPKSNFIIGRIRKDTPTGIIQGLVTGCGKPLNGQIKINLCLPLVFQIFKNRGISNEIFDPLHTPIEAVPTVAGSVSPPPLSHVVPAASDGLYHRTEASTVTPRGSRTASRAAPVAPDCRARVKVALPTLCATTKREACKQQHQWLQSV